MIPPTRKRTAELWAPVKKITVTAKTTPALDHFMEPGIIRLPVIEMSTAFNALRKTRPAVRRLCCAHVSVITIFNVSFHINRRAMSFQPGHGYKNGYRGGAGRPAAI